PLLWKSLFPFRKEGSHDFPRLLERGAAYTKLGKCGQESLFTALSLILSLYRPVFSLLGCIQGFLREFSRDDDMAPPAIDQGLPRARVRQGVEHVRVRSRLVVEVCPVTVEMVFH